MTDMPNAGFLCAGKTPLALSVSVHCAYKMMEVFRSSGFEICACHTVITEPYSTLVCESARKTLRHICSLCDVVITVGCDGFALSDIMPDITEAVCDRKVPYFSSVLCGLMKLDGVSYAPSRALSMLCGETLVMNFPSDAASAASLISALMPAVGFTVYSLSGKSAKNCAEFKNFLNSSLDFHEVFKKECIVNL